MPPLSRQRGRPFFGSLSVPRTFCSIITLRLQYGKEKFSRGPGAGSETHIFEGISGILLDVLPVSIYYIGAIDDTLEAVAVRQKKIRSVWPVYIAAGLWALYALLFPLYHIWGLLLCAVVSALGYFLSQRLFFRPKLVEIPAPAPKKPEAPSEKSKNSPEVDAVIAEGNLAQKELGRLYQSIRDQSVREKISELMRVSDKIVDDARSDPSDVPQIKKFLSYYLPTTIKLLNAYDRMDAQGIEGENISGTMSRIESMLDTAVVSFEKQLDSLFADQALDIETDIDVMNAMLKREGLAGKDFGTSAG